MRTVVNWKGMPGETTMPDPRVCSGSKPDSSEGKLAPLSLVGFPVCQLVRP
jgi:hypothetical protein